MKNKTVLVAQRELVENMRTKAFWIGIFVFPILIAAAMVVPSLLERTKGARQYAVVDQSGWLLEEIENRAAMPDLEKVFRRSLERLEAGGSSFDELPSELQEVTRQLRAGLGMAMDRFGSDWSDEERVRNEERIVSSYAGLVAGHAGTQGAAIREMLPEEAVTELERQRGAIRDWWLSLPADEASEYGSGLSKSRYVRVDVDTAGPAEQLYEDLNQRVADGDLFAYIVIGEDPETSTDGSRYVSSNLTDDDLQGWFSRLATDVVRDRRLASKEIDRETADWISQRFALTQTKIGAGGEEAEVEAKDRVRQWAPVAFVYLLWISIFTVAQMLLTNTVEEKSNKLMEVLLSSVSPLQLMIGKIAGIAATGLAMLGSWAFFFWAITKFLPKLIGIEPGFDLSVIVTDPKYMASFFIYFVLGYLFYAALLVGIGSVCDSLKEAQNLMQPIMLVLFVPLVSMVPIGQDPNGLLARVLSYIPPFTPFVMMNRAAGPPPTWEYVVTTVLLLLSVAGVTWAAAKVFRVGVLMTGKPPKVSELVRWVRAPIGVVPERGES